MLLDFDAMREVTVPNMNGGEGEIRARMHMVPEGKTIVTRMAPGSSIGNHLQATSFDINYVLSGTGMATCDGVEEELRPGVCHICPPGSMHSIANTGNEELVLFTVVAEQPKEA